MKGILYVVATPIGNLEDITYRAVNILKSADVILAEDTRHARKLLDFWSIAAPKIISLHDHNQIQRLPLVEEMLNEERRVALISDAGTPLISDPGFVLVDELKNKGYCVSPIPGPSAAIAALSSSGLKSDHFYFEGFLSAKRSARQTRLQELVDMRATLIFYEAPHRIKDCIKDMENVFGADKIAVIAREMTKQFETIVKASLGDLNRIIADDQNMEKGEMVILVDGNYEKKESNEEDIKKVLVPLLKVLPLKQAVKVACEITDEHRNYLYNLALTLKP